MSLLDQDCYYVSEHQDCDYISECQDSEDCEFIKKSRTFCRFHGGGDDKIRPANDDILLRLEMRG